MVELMTARALIDALDLMGWSIAFNEKGEQAGMNETHVVATKGILKIEALDRWSLGSEPDRLHVLQSIYDRADVLSEYQGIPIREIEAIDTTTRYRWDVAWGEARVISRPMVYFEGYPPRPDESTREYLERMADELPYFAPRARLYRQRWWQFWRARR